MTDRPSEEAPSVAVLLATYDGERWLDDQLSTILGQRDVRVHLFARDDGSTDSTSVILHRWRERRPDAITILPSHERSGSAAMNFFALLRQAPLDGFDHVALADQDDIWFPDKLARAVAELRRHDAEGYSSNLLAYDDAAARGWLMDKAGADAPLDYLFQGASAGCTYVLTRRAAETVVGVLRELPVAIFPHASHDWTIYAICRSRGLGWVRDPSARIMYRQHAVNVYGARPGLGGLRQRARLMGERWYRRHILWLRHVVAGAPTELAVIDALARGGPRDRLRLARRARDFRRAPREVALLRAALLAGLV